MKLSFQLVDKLIEQHCSRQDINFIVLIAQWQQDDGTIYNLNYKDVITSIDIAPKTYFDILNRLEEKEIISIQESDKYGYRHITLYSNDFTDKDFNQGYININRDFFFSNQFYAMKASAKYVLFKILKRNNDKYNNIPCTEDTIAKYADINAKNKRLVRYIIEVLKDFSIADRKIFEVFSQVGSRNKIVHHFKLQHIDRRSIAHESSHFTKTELDIRKQHMFMAFCKKHHLPYIAKDINDLIQMDYQYKSYHSYFISIVSKLLHQYKRKIKEVGNLQFVCKAIRDLVEPNIKLLTLNVNERTEYVPLV